MKVLVLEDEPDIRFLLQLALEPTGLSVTAVGSIAEAREALGQQDFDVVVLDLSLPDGSGLEILGELRWSGCPAHVIVLSASAAEADRVRAFTLGADDYVLKPFPVLDFTGRVLAVRRRLEPAEDTHLTIGHVGIDLGARRVLVHGRPVATTTKEFDLLAFLATRPGATFSGEDLLRSVWDSAPDRQLSSTVSEHVRRLRSKIEDDPRQPTLIVTVRGSGYRLDPPDAPPGGPHVGTGTIIHLEGRIVSADLDAKRIFGGDDDTLVGKHLFELAAPTSEDASELRTRVTLPGDALRSELMALRRLDGSSFSAEVSSSTTDWGGERAGCVSVTPTADPAAGASCGG